MAGPEPSTSTEGGAGSTAGPAGLSPQQLERLVDLVYYRLKEDLLRQRERRGETSGRAWR
ncbi:MAG TPA: hypothetical protein VNN10_10635 [Dehalococcoidia bacterium]|nr:hypothetical protein [Dehalococcoidia bacterium]